MTIKQQGGASVKELTSEERVLRVLRRQEPDRVPHFEWAIDKKVRAALAPGCASLNEFAARMGLDAVLADPDYRKEPRGPGKWRSEWGYVLQESAGGARDRGGVSHPDDAGLRALHAARTPTRPGATHSVEKTLREFGGKKAVIVHLNDVFSLPRYLMGYENLLMAIAAEPELVTRAGRTCRWISTSPWQRRW